jgi:hypothetical protein
VVLARGLLSSTQDDPAELLREVAGVIDAPVAGAVFNGQAAMITSVLPLQLPQDGNRS